MKFHPLWDKPPEWMNERCFDRTRYPKLAAKYADTADRVSGPGFDPQSDLRTIARLLAWVLTPNEPNKPDAKVRREVPSRDQAGWTKARVWSVLKDATDQTKTAFADAGAFADALEVDADKPSQHFIEQNWAPPKPPEPWWKRWGLPILGSAALIAAVVAAVWILRPSGAPEPGVLDALCPECPRTSKLQEIGLRYIKAKKDPVLEAEALKAMYDPAALSPHESYQKGERVCRERLLEATLARLPGGARNSRGGPTKAGWSPPRPDPGEGAERPVRVALHPARAARRSPRSTSRGSRSYRCSKS